MQTLDSSEDVDLELMFAEIRRYPLLTADEEKSIDSRKWHAVETLSRVFGEVADLRVILAEVLHNALECPPEAVGGRRPRDLQPGVGSLDGYGDSERGISSE